MRKLLMLHEWHVLRNEGLRYWLAYVLVRLAHRLEDTEYYQIISGDGFRINIIADKWGCGVTSGSCVDWENDSGQGWPLLREFDNLDAAFDWDGVA